MKSYSPLFHTLYDEDSPVGNLGRGTHYSILSAVQWVDLRKRMLAIPKIQRFAVIWDEDHDARVIDVIERAYMSGIFAPVLYVGERKAFLTVVVSKEFFKIIQADWASYNLAWKNLCSEVCGDHWTFELYAVDSSDNGIIADSHEKVSTYLENINNLWSLGLNTYLHPNRNMDHHNPPPLPTTPPFA